MNKSRHSLARIGLLLAALALTLGALEIVVAAVPLVPESLFTDDPVLGWRMRANAQTRYFRMGCPREFDNLVITNSQGAHDIEPPPPSANRRLLIVGDSITAALEVPIDALMPRLLENRLDQAAPTEVIAFGQAGYSTAQAWRYVQGEGLAHQPDAVLLLFTPHNDFSDNHPAFEAMSIDWVYQRPYYTMDEAGALAEMPTEATAPSLHRFLLGQSRLYQFLSLRLRMITPPVDLTGPAMVQARAESWVATYALIEALRDTVEAAGVRFGVVIEQSIVPDGERAAIHELFGAGLAERGIAHLSLLAPFESAAEPPRYPCDTHWTPAGHQIAAEAIAPFAESLLAPG